MGGLNEADSDLTSSDNAGSGKLAGIDQAFSAAFDAIESKDKPTLSDALKEDAPESAPDKVKTKPEAKAAKVKSQAKPRDEEKTGEEPTDEHAENVSEASKPDGEDDGATTSFEAPKHWPEADRKAFAGLPKDGQDILLKISKNLQGGFTRKSQELSDKAKFADEVRSRFNEADRAQMAQAGVDERQTIDYLLNVQRFATKNPTDYIKWAMQNLGVKPEQIFGPQAPQASQPGQQQPDPRLDPMAELLADPAVKQLEARVAHWEAIERQREQEQAHYQRQQQEAQRAQHIASVNTIQREIATFRQSLDDGGNLQFPHFDQVQKHMGALMDSDPDLVAMPDSQEKLQKAYDMAIWARPDLRSTFIEAETQKRTQALAKKADVAKAARATAVKPAAGVVSTRGSKRSLDDIIADSMGSKGF